MADSSAHSAEWLTETQDWLSACRKVREFVGWEEITKRIDPSWLERNGWGPSTPVEIGVLRGKLISEPVPRTSGPAKPAPNVEPTISYVEARDRVGHAWFGNVFGLSLTEDERYDLGAGPWQASSAAAYRSANEKAKKIEWRHNQVDTWLADNGLIDPMRRQHGLEMPPINRKKFEVAFFPVFGEPESLRGELERAYAATIRGELERASADQSAYVRALQTRSTPWSPPEGLTLDQGLAVIGDEPRPFLAIIVDLLAFGVPLPEKIYQLLGLLSRQEDRDDRSETCKVLADEGYPVEKVASQRMRAATALFEGVRRAEKPVLVGSIDHHTDQSIPPNYFDVPRNLGFEDNTIATDLAAIVDDPRWQKQFDAERENKPAPWVNVRVDFKWFMGWLTSQLVKVVSVGGLPALPNEGMSVVPRSSPESAPRSGPKPGIMQSQKQSHQCFPSPITGPVPVKGEAAKKIIRDGLHNGKFTISELLGGARGGGFKQEHVAELLGMGSRSHAMKLVREVAQEPEFSAEGQVVSDEPSTNCDKRQIATM